MADGSPWISAEFSLALGAMLIPSPYQRLWAEMWRMARAVCSEDQGCQASLAGLGPLWPGNEQMPSLAQRLERGRGC